MSRLVSRILLSILMFPLAVVFYIFVFIFGTHYFRSPLGYYSDYETYTFATSSLLTWILVAVYWGLLWKSSVKWNSDRYIFTAVAVIIALIVAALAATAANSVVSMRAGMSTFLGGLLAIVLWLIFTVFIWRETPAERVQRLAASPANSIACPTCGYNLTGLTESRCPECGSKFTLDELLASQPKSEID